ncbi:MAG: hypothetical protein JJT95_08340 [Pararhodobacter sp.]|nr:hypothetical protein [Pararhodobacter sp.]
MRYSNMQWYLSQAGNTVHLVALFPERLEPDKARAMLSEAFRTLPSLALADLPGQDRIAPAASGPLDPPGAAAMVLETSEVSSLPDNPAAFLAPAPFLFDDPALPALRARLLTLAPGAEGSTGSVLSIAVSHALVEGADLSALMRGGRNRRQGAAEPRFGVFSRFGLALGAPVLAALHLFLARREKRRRDGFGFAVVELDAAALRHAARRLGLRRRSLLFSCVLHALTDGPAGRRLGVSYSHMPPNRVTLEDDSQLAVRVNFLSLRREATPEAFARQIEHQLRRRDESEVLTQFLNNRVLGWHRRAIRLFPSLYGGAFFGFAPYEMVLSLVHPLRPAGEFGAFGQARIIGGSMTGTAPSCIMVQANGRVGLCLWIEHDRMARLSALRDNLLELGIDCTAFTREGAVPVAPAASQAGNVAQAG